MRTGRFLQAGFLSVLLSVIFLSSGYAQETDNVPAPEAITGAETSAPSASTEGAVASESDVPAATVEPELTANQEMVKGAVEQIAEDGSFIIVNGQKISTTQKFLEDSYLEVGDKVMIVAEKNDSGLTIKSYNYIFDEDVDAEALPDEVSGGEGQPTPSQPVTPQGE